MTRKLGYTNQLVFDVSEQEKKQAELVLLYFERVLKILRKCDEHLNILYTPFKNSNLTSDRIFKYRVSLRRFRDQALKNFNEFKVISFKCFSVLQKFSSDTHIAKLNKSFVSSISDIEKQVNKFAELFSDLGSTDFPNGVVKSIENIKKEISQLEQIIEDRIQPHLQNNILSRNWVDNVSSDLKEKIEEKVPLSVELVNNRENLLTKYKEQGR